MANDDSLAAEIADAARRAGEAMWPMPLPEDLRKGLDSTVADIANVAADRSGGMLVAGLFLREFVPDGVRWAHLDIAGPAYQRRRPVRVHRQGRHRGGGQDAGPDRGGRGGRQACG